MAYLKVFEKLSEDWEDVQSLVMFGFGKVGRGGIEALRCRIPVNTIIDNNDQLHGQFYKGIPIVNFKEYRAMGIQEKIVVFTSGNRYKSIAEELVRSGYVEYKDFCDFSTFFNDYFWKLKKENFIGRLHINITTFCTLNCKHCTIHTAYNNYKKNFRLESIKRDIDLIFRMVDYLGNLLILGGEPFIHSDLKDILIYIGEHYQNTIGTVQVITNGTVRASDELLETVKKYDIEIRISDYTARVPYSEKLKWFYDDMQRHQINYVSYSHDEWLDMGFPEEDVNMGNTVQELREHMFRCSPNCQNVVEGKLYYCAQGWSADQTQLFRLNETEYLDLESIKNDADRKEKFRQFYFGKQEDWYFSFCKVCRGWDTDRTVPGGIQYEEGLVRKIKILQFTVASSKGGVTQHILQNWKYIDKSKFQFDFVTMSKTLDFSDELEQEGCKVFYISCYAEEDKDRFIYEIKKILSEGQYDVVHLHTKFWKSFIVEQLAKEAGIKKIIVHANSAGVDTSDKKKREEEQQTHNNLLGDLTEKIATDYWACSKMANGNRGFKLLLVGSGDKEKEYREIVEKKDLEEKVIFVGQRTDVPELLRVMDVLCLPSRFEGLPIFMIEAQASGLHCIGSACITDEIKICDNVVLLPLVKDEWSHQILQCLGKGRGDNKMRLVEGGYDIRSQIKVVEKYYRRGIVYNNFALHRIGACAS